MPLFYTSCDGFFFLKPKMKISSFIRIVYRYKMTFETKDTHKNSMQEMGCWLKEEN